MSLGHKRPRLDTGDEIAQEQSLGEARRAVPISVDGDVVFIVGAQKKHLLVHSAVLSSASDAFEALLSDRFQEGQQPRTSERPAMIPLPGDDCVAMTDLCRLIHHQSPFCFAEIEPKRLFDLSSAIDKYCCADALNLQCEALLLRAYKEWRGRSTEHKWFVESIGALATAAYNMEQPRYFQKFTAELMLGHRASFSRLGNHKTAGSDLPSNALLALEEVRAALRLGIERDLKLAAETHWRHPLDYRYQLHQLIMYATELDEWPPLYHTGRRGCSLSDIIEPLQAGKNWPTIGCACKGDCSKYMGIKTIVDRVKNSFAGLCLECVRMDTIAPTSDLIRSYYSDSDPAAVCPHLEQ